jgi:translocation and assembly module TamB
VRALGILWRVLAWLGVLVLILITAGIIVMQTEWFREKVRERLVEAIEDATGGEVEIGEFRFDWRGLRVEIHGFILRGTEPPDEPPLFRARLLRVNLRLLTAARRPVEVDAVLIDVPQVNIIVFKDGSTNIPPRILKEPPPKTALETVVDLAVGRFELTNGSVRFAERRVPLDARGRNLRVQLFYDRGMPGYKGLLAMAPIEVRSGARAPVEVNLSVPLAITGQRIRFENAVIRTDESELSATGALSEIRNPRIEARVTGRLSLPEARRAAGLGIRAGANVPRLLHVDVSLDSQGPRTVLSAARLRLGGSTIQASGVLRDAGEPEGVRFSGQVNVGEIGRLFGVSQRPEGTARVSGRAAFRKGGYLVRADIDARGLAITLGPERFTGATLTTAMRLDPRRAEFTNVRLGILGGIFTGRAEIEQWDRFEAAGQIAGYDAGLLAATFADFELPWGGTLSGPVEARGQFRALADLAASGRLTVSPAPARGVPMRGRLNASFNGRTDTLVLRQSWIALPQSRVDFSGTLGRRLDVRLASRNLNELAPGENLPVRLNGGAAAFNGAVLGSLRSPRVAGNLRLANFRIAERPFTLLTGAVDLSSSRVALDGGTLRRGPLDARFSAAMGLRRYRPYQQAPLAVNALIRNADVRDALAVAGQADVPATGTFDATASVAGTLASPRGEVVVNVADGSLWQQPFDTLAARAQLSEGLIDLPVLRVAANGARLSATARYNYAPGELRRGVLNAQVATNQVQLEQVRALVAERPGLGGTAAFNATVAANIYPSNGETRVDLARLNADLAVRGLRMEGQDLGDLTASARTAGNIITYNAQSNFAGSSIQAAGRTALSPGYPTEATAEIANLPLATTLAVAGRPEIDASGNLSARARVAGTLANPDARAEITLQDAAYEQYPVDRVQATIHLTNRVIDVPSLVAEAGNARVQGSARLLHPGDYRTGDLQFQVSTNRFEIAQVPAAVKLEPRLGGTVEARAEGAATLRAGADPLLQRLNGLVTASALRLDSAPLGNLYAAAETRGGDLTFNVKSDLAGSDVRAGGRLALGGDYPIDANLTFERLTWAGLRPLLRQTGQRNFDAVAAGKASVSGPLARPEDLKGRAEVTRLDMYSVASVPGAPERRALQVRSAEPVVVALERSTLRIESARFIGPYANMEVTGTAAIRAPHRLDLRATGDFRLDLVQAFIRDAYATGEAELNAAVRGTASRPLIVGRVDLEDASFNMIGWPAGLSEAQGAILFTGRQAALQNVTGLVGGGKVTLAGNVGYGGPDLSFRIEATAEQVRVQYPENVSTSMDAELSLSGTTDRSLLSGEVTILDVAFFTHTDVGSILAGAARPTPVPAAEVGVRAGMRLDIRVVTAPDVQFRTTLAENIEADAEVQVRGTAARPGALGRLDVTAGEVEFFGTRYHIDQGAVAFYDPNSLEPIVNIDLTTRARGIDVTITIAGPMDRLQLTYRSDPPLQFSELVGLLATGAVPTTDPVLVAREPATPQQTFQQMGASTLLGQAVASPVAGRLQRLFGVTTLRIDPQIMGAENVPQARVTLQQQVTQNLLFTYIQSVTESNPLMIQVEWTFSPIWSAIIQRQENGAAALDLYWRRRFR